MNERERDMADGVAGGYMLKRLELEVLLKGLGFEQVFGFEGTGAEDGRPEVVYGLKRLAEAGLVASDGERFEVAGPLRGMLLQMGHAKRVLRLAAGVECPVLCCYGGEMALVSELAPQQADAVRLTLTGPALLWRRLVDEGYLPRLQSVEDAAAEAPWQPLSEAEGEGEPVFAAEVLERDGSCSRSLAVTEQGLGYRVVHSGPQGSRWRPYRQSRMPGLLQGLWDEMKEEG